MRLKVIACDGQRREICAAAARSRHCVELEFLPGSLRADLLLAAAQNAIDRAASSAPDAVVLAYALCGMPVAGLESRGAPLVAPRPTGCDGFHANRHGVCFRSTGWAESARDCRGAATYRHSTYLTTSPGGRPAIRQGPAEFPAATADREMLDKMVTGAWDRRLFLVVPPGWRAILPPDGCGLGQEPVE